MKAVIAIDSLKGSLSSLQAGEAIRAGILRVDPDADVQVRPLADGGEGTVSTHHRNSRIVSFSRRMPSMSCSSVALE